MKKRTTCLIIAVLAVVLINGCGQQTFTYEFREDQNGQIAKNFFPDLQTLPESVQTEFEYKNIPSLISQNLMYEGYYLKLVFDTEPEYTLYLEATEHDNSDMTEEQRRHSYYIIDEISFSVEDYSFRAIDLGDVDPYIGLIGHCDSERTIVFLYFYNEFGTIESISDGLGPHGYLPYYRNSWNS
jgi:hypothetical protein